VFSHIKARPEQTIGVLDTSHSQGGWAVAKACHLLGKQCVLYFPVRKANPGSQIPHQQQEAGKLGAQLVPLAAGRSAILYHRAGKLLTEQYPNSYLMPNALKLPETVQETAEEFLRTPLPKRLKTILVSASSGTIAAGLFLGAHKLNWKGKIIVHLGYSRPEGALRRYMQKMAGVPIDERAIIVDEGYTYSDASDVEAPFPCDRYYDAKALAWWLNGGRREYGKALLWNIG
jgi:hypothetical protein